MADSVAALYERRTINPTPASRFSRKLLLYSRNAYERKKSVRSKRPSVSTKEFTFPWLQNRVVEPLVGLERTFQPPQPLVVLGTFPIALQIAQRFNAG